VRFGGVCECADVVVWTRERRPVYRVIDREAVRSVATYNLPDKTVLGVKGCLNRTRYDAGRGAKCNCTADPAKRIRRSGSCACTCGSAARAVQCVYSRGLTTTGRSLRRRRRSTGGGGSGRGGRSRWRLAREDLPDGAMLVLVLDCG
jgi:hypothetical protein